MNKSRVRAVLVLVSVIMICVSIVPVSYGLLYTPDVDTVTIVPSEPIMDPTDSVVGTTEPAEITDAIDMGSSDSVDETIPTETVIKSDAKSTREETQHVHNYSTIMHEPDCESQGYVQHVCICGDEYCDSYVSATGHVLSDWVVTQEATVLSEGVKTRSCSVCSFIVTESIPVIKIVVPAGYGITFDSSLSDMNTDTAVYELFVSPSESDFSAFYAAAVDIYTAIINAEDSVTVYLPRDGIGDIAAMSDGEIEAAMRVVMDDFIQTFNQKVLNGHCKLRVSKSSYFAGMICVDIQSMRDVISDMISDKSAYNRANVSAGLYNGMSEREAAIAINNWICNRMYYSGGYNHPLDVLSIGHGNCTSYALLFHAMCRDAGIACDVVSGTVIKSDGEASHAWNRVRIGGSWYYIDVCWNDNSPANQYLFTDMIWEDHCVISVGDVYY